MKIRQIGVVFVLIALLVGCAGEPAAPTATLKPTATGQPTATSAPPSPTAEATETLEPTPSPEPTEVTDLTGGVVRSELQRETTPDVEPVEVATRADNINAFAFDLYQVLIEDGENVFYSPYSIAMALAMTYAGAEGETEQQMVDTLRITLAEPTVHAAFNALDRAITQRGAEVEEEIGAGFELNVANAIWGQAGYPFRAEYLDLLARHYGSGLRTLDFRSSPEAAREVINQWVSQETEGRIEELMGEGSISELTRLVLTNAIYFKATWQHPFTKELTEELPFTTLAGEEITVPMMKQTVQLRYAEGETYQAIELPYVGSFMSMVVVMPDEGDFEAFEGSLDAERMDGVIETLKSQNVALTMPKFEYDASYQMAETLSAMGMPDAFSPEGANFSGIDGSMDLFIQKVVHKAYVSVDEEGTEAAAATGVAVGITSAPMQPVQMTIDRPFVFIIRDIESGTMLFVGRVLDPSR
jgi:serpin B